MNNMTIKEYAKSKGVSYEAIRKQIDLYKDELQGHIIYDGKKRLLSPEAIEILNTKRENNKIIVMKENKDQELVELRDKIEQQSVILFNMQTAMQKQIDENNALHKELHEKEEQLLNQEKEHSKNHKELYQQLISKMDDLKAAELDAAIQKQNLKTIQDSIKDLENQNQEYKLLLEKKDAEAKAEADKLKNKKYSLTEKLKILFFR